MATMAPAAGSEGATKLRKFWVANTKEFSTWFLLMSDEERLEAVKEAGPDLPQSGPSAGTRMSPTDILLPELTYDGMLAGNGRCLVLFFTRRTMENVDTKDLELLNMLHGKNAMPLFSDGKFEHLALAFVNPNDPEENVLGLAKDATAEQIAARTKQVDDGVYIDADVWLAKRVRQGAIETFLQAMVEVYNRATAVA